MTNQPRGTVCERCGRKLEHGKAIIWQREEKGIISTIYVCSKCDNYMQMYSEPAYLPGRPDRTRLDAYIESLERENNRTPKSKIKKFVKDLLKEGWSFRKIGEELGVGMEGALLIGAEIQENMEEEE